MIKVLLVGDMHVVPEELQDCQKVIDAIYYAVDDRDIDMVVFMGDQHHTHAVVRLEVLAFWREALLRLGSSCKVVLLKGNHDAPADVNSHIHVLEAYEGLPNVVVVSSWDHIDGIDFVAYMPAQAFVETVKDLKAPTLICHQTFQGAQYENGFFAHDGIELSLTPHKHVYSGHIHTPQSWDKLVYVGSPRWRTVSDANVNRFLQLITFIDGVPVDIDLIPSPAQPIESCEARWPNTEISWVHPHSKKYVSIFGDKSYVEATTEAYLRVDTTTKIRTFVDQKQIVVKESEGIQNAINRFIDSYQAKNGTPSNVLKQMMNERLVLSNV